MFSGPIWSFEKWLDRNELRGLAAPAVLETTVTAERFEICTGTEDIDTDTTEDDAEEDDRLEDDDQQDDDDLDDIDCVQAGKVAIAGEDSAFWPAQNKVGVNGPTYTQ